MKPLTNLKSFLAALLILILPASLLVAYFRDYSPGAGGHEHSDSGKGGVAASDKGATANADKGHDQMAMPQGGQMHPEEPGAASARDQPMMAMPSALPGFPGAASLYHIGATGFFLDHPEHITLSSEQNRRLNQIKEKALMGKASTDERLQDAEEELWALTGVDQPDVAQIDSRIRAIEKLRADQRLNFIRSVGQAAEVLTDEQRQAVLGAAAPASHSEHR